MTITRVLGIPAFVLLLTCGAAGCASKSEGPELAAVSGTVKYRGKPLENASVVFLPDAQGQLLASGTTDSKGHYQLTTRNTNDGALVGKHRVTVTLRGPNKKLPEDQLTTGLPGSNFEPGDALIPQRYFLPDTSGLMREVKPGSNTVDLELND